MPTYTIRRYPDPCLRKKALPVEEVTSRERKILARMAETMYSAEGVGLAGPQVGINKRLIVVDTGDGLLKLVNPELVRTDGGDSTMEEGCLSIPEVVLNIKRADRIIVEGLTETGEHTQVSAEGLFAHALQHEMDHLEGILILDRGKEREKRKFKSALEKFEESEFSEKK